MSCLPATRRRVALLGCCALLVVQSATTIAPLQVASAAVPDDATEPAQSVAAVAASSSPRPAESTDSSTGTKPTPLQIQLRARDKAQVTAALHGIAGHTGAFVAPAIDQPASTPVLVLVRRPEPYDLTQLAAAFPEVLGALPGGSVRLNLPLLVGPGATLAVDSAKTPSVLLSSGSQSYADIIAVQGTVALTGSGAVPLTIRSDDPSTNRADADLADGRAYIRASHSTMTFDHVNASGLGYLIGETSGIAWMAQEDAPSTGGARDSTFSGNYFGAYSSGAAGLAFARVSFTDNTIYGFDPHTDTTGTVIEDSVAARNGRHGLIFSRACSNNVIRRFESYDNGGSGIVIDDGNDDGDTATQGSDANQVVAVNTHNNGAAGIVIEGGTANSVEQSRIEANPVGVWVKNGAAGTSVTSTSIRASEQTGIRLEGGTTSSHATDVTIEQASVGIADEGATATALTNVRIEDAAAAGITVAPGTSQLTLKDVSIAGQGGQAYAIASSATGAAASASPPAGLDTRDWTPSQMGFHGKINADFWVQLIPWLLVFVIPALLWFPVRWRWRRRQRTMHGEAGE